MASLRNESGDPFRPVYLRQHGLALTLREIGRVERALFIVEARLDADMQRRGRTVEGQHFRMAGLTLLTGEYRWPKRG